MVFLNGLLSYKNKLSRTGQKFFSCVPYATDILCRNAKWATNRWDLLWGKDMIQGNYNQNRESFILEFLYLEEYLALRIGQVLDQMR